VTPPGPDPIDSKQRIFNYIDGAVDEFDWETHYHEAGSDEKERIANSSMASHVASLMLEMDEDLFEVLLGDDYHNGDGQKEEAMVKAIADLPWNQLETLSGDAITERLLHELMINVRATEAVNACIEMHVDIPVDDGDMI